MSHVVITKRLSKTEAMALECRLIAYLHSDNRRRGYNRTAGGFKWKYLTDVDESEITDSFLLQKYYETRKGGELYETNVK